MMTSENTKTEIAIRLEDGTEHAWTVAKLPKYWKSWAVNQLPYGTSVLGAVITANRVRDPFAGMPNAGDEWNKEI